MPALNFKKQFAEAVRSGDKHQTIRRKRKRPFVVGDTVQLYTGQRTKSCEKLGEGYVDFVCNIYIGEDERIKVTEHYHNLFKRPHYLDPGLCKWYYTYLRPDQIKDLAIADGFKSTEEFMQFFRDSGLPFEGQLIVWSGLNECPL